MTGTELTLSQPVLVAIVLAPLLGSIIAGLFGKFVGRTGAHIATIAGVAISCALSISVLWQLQHGAASFNQNLYTWFDIGGISAHVGFMVDNLTAMMMVVVTFVSLLVHLYTIGYMHEDPGYQRFFSYISLFTFSMLMLVMSNNFLQLFFGWEAVGLVSYLLIGFWFKKPTAVFANLKAFLVNRVGDFGFLLGIAGVLYWLGTLDYAQAFAGASKLNSQVEIFAGHPWTMATVVCICLFIGAMGKSAQVPLHVWLPDSMEGPTPISALIHAATMVTAGIFMVARMSPLFELSQTALNFVLFIGATTAFWTGLIGMVQNDIKRVVAYSTLSQLGYMTVALGVSAYSAAVFHLMTHAFFKALLFLAAGSVIIGMHHEQDMRKMGGLRKYMPITYWTSLIGTLALVGTPFFSGFYSKDTIIEAAAEHAHEHGGAIAQYAYWAVLLGAFVTSFYSFRLLYMTFFGIERFRDAHDDHHAHDDHGHNDAHHGAHEPHESPWVVTVPLVLLAIPSIVVGFFTIGPMLHGKGTDGHALGKGFFDGVIQMPADGAMAKLGEEFHGALAMALHGFTAMPFFLALAGFLLATVMYVWRPELPAKAAKVFALPIRILEEKYGFDKLWINGFAGGSVLLGRLSRWFDSKVIDEHGVNGAARDVNDLATLIRRGSTGYLYQYAFAMIIGLILLLAWLIKVAA
ncbi:NADH-quinone oxidoreductase subunit L [Lysobacter soyae]|uniref:NADH-quinone oxidoreductase subunit L n=1 Tax=Lysobacter soyae TaxID=2764185 RepID=A0ABX8WMP3_9GAMM|nr:NADH-quinone oxidoreductase subunit L [Lysobacter sp. CJ11]QYR52083.1 NADH-quinone oxidoreductase subunit L [Lysobacter sp. CJ11]